MASTPSKKTPPKKSEPLEETKIPPKEAPKRRTATSSKPPEGSTLAKLALIAGSGLLALLVVWGIVYTATTHKSSPSSDSSQQTISKIDRSISGKSEEADQRDATAAVTAMLQAADISPGNKTAGERLQALDKNDFSVVDPKLVEAVHFGPTVTSEFKAKTYQALITISSVVKNSSSNKTIGLVSPSGWQNAYCDSSLGTVFVPLNGYAEQGALFSFEMIYTPQGWKLAPYSLLDAINISATIQGQDASAAPTASPTK